MCNDELLDPHWVLKQYTSATDTGIHPRPDQLAEAARDGLGLLSLPHSDHISEERCELCEAWLIKCWKEMDPNLLKRMFFGSDPSTNPQSGFTVAWRRALQEDPEGVPFKIDLMQGYDVMDQADTYRMYGRITSCPELWYVFMLFAPAPLHSPFTLDLWSTVVRDCYKHHLKRCEHCQQQLALVHSAAISVG